MDLLLVGGGIAFLLAAIVGGGIKGAGFELPALPSFGSRIAVAIFGIGLIGISQQKMLSTIFLDNPTTTPALQQIPTDTRIIPKQPDTVNSLDDDNSLPDTDEPTLDRPDIVPVKKSAPIRVNFGTKVLRRLPTRPGESGIGFAGCDITNKGPIPVYISNYTFFLNYDFGQQRFSFNCIENCFVDVGDAITLGGPKLVEEDTSKHRCSVVSVKSN